MTNVLNNIIHMNLSLYSIVCIVCIQKYSNVSIQTVNDY